MEDKVNSPNHYRNLKNLFTESGEPAQVIDIIEDWTQCFKGGKATNFGNTIKYFFRCGKKAADVSYQSSQKEKNIEESGKMVWYTNRFANCPEPLLKVTYKPHIKTGEGFDADINDFVNAIQNNYPENCQESVVKVITAMSMVKESGSKENIDWLISSINELHNLMLLG